MTAFLLNRTDGTRVAGSGQYVSRYSAMAEIQNLGFTHASVFAFPLNRRTDRVGADEQVARRCTGCGQERHLIGENAQAAFRFQRTYDPPRFMTRCRECERAAGRNRRAAAPSGTATSRALAGDRSFGVELEVNCSNRSALQIALNNRNLSSWRLRGDGSLGRNGVELVSPPLRGAEGFDQLRKACEALAEAGATVDRACGLHVHVDLSGISAAAVKRMVKAYVGSQGIIDGLFSESRRNGRNTYCRTWDSYMLERLEQCSNVATMSRAQGSRYHTVNLASFPRHGTIEFRQHQGTTSYRKVEAWVKFLTALVATCVRNEIDRQTNVADLMTAVRVDEDAAAFLIGRAVQFNAVQVTAPAVTAASPF